MNIETTKDEQGILLHTLGIGNIRFNEKDKINRPPRNYFYTSKDTDDYPMIKSLIDKKLMYNTNQHWPQEKGSTYFAATDEGIALAQKLAFSAIPKMTKSQIRYRLYLVSETTESFIEWLKNGFWDDYRKRNGA